MYYSSLTGKELVPIAKRELLSKDFLHLGATVTSGTTSTDNSTPEFVTIVYEEIYTDCISASGILLFLLLLFLMLLLFFWLVQCCVFVIKGDRGVEDFYLDNVGARNPLIHLTIALRKMLFSNKGRRHITRKVKLPPKKIPEEPYETPSSIDISPRQGRAKHKYEHDFHKKVPTPYKKGKNYRTGKDLSSKGSDSPSLEKDLSKSKHDLSKSGNESSKSGQDLSKRGHDKPKKGRDTPKKGSDKPKRGLDTPKKVPDTPKKGRERPARAVHVSESPEYQNYSRSPSPGSNNSQTARFNKRFPRFVFSSEQQERADTIRQTKGHTESAPLLPPGKDYFREKAKK